MQMMLSDGHQKGLPALPETLAARGIGLRLEQPDADLAFLEQLYFSVRWEELDPTGWPDQAKIDFLHSQFDMQTHHYRTHYHDAVFAIITQDGDTPIGRLYLFRGAKEHRIVDISLIPAARSQGIGAQLLSSVQAEAHAQGCKVSIHVESFNPARRLYDRLGFVPVNANGPYHLMEWPSSPLQSSSES